MVKYLKKPSVVEAIQFNDNEDEVVELIGKDAHLISGKLIIATEVAPITVRQYQWVLKNENEECFVLSNVIFKADYNEYQTGER